MSRTIPLRPELVELTGDVVAALILQQLCFWTSRTQFDGGWIYRTSDELEEELSGGVSSRTIRRKLGAMVKADLLEERPTHQRRVGNSKDYRVVLKIDAIRRAVEQSAQDQNRSKYAKRTNCPDTGQNDQQPDSLSSTPSDDQQEPDSDNRTDCPSVGQNDQQPDSLSAPPIIEKYRETNNYNNDAHDPNEQEFEVFVQEQLTEYGLFKKAGESRQIATRIILSELPKEDYRRYLVDWLVKLRQKVDDTDDPTDREQAIDWLGGARSVAWWNAQVKAARTSEKKSTSSAKGDGRLTVSASGYMDSDQAQKFLNSDEEF